MAVLDVLVGTTFFVAALVFRRTPRFALLAVATGVLWFLGDVVGFLVFAHRGPLTHLFLIYPAIRLAGRIRGMIISGCYLFSFAYPLARLDAVTILLSVSIIAVSLWRPAHKTAPEWIAGVGAVAMWGALGLAAILRSAAVDVTAQLLLAYELVLLTMTAMLMIDYRYRRSRVATVSTLAVDLGQAEAVSLRDVLAATLGDPSLVLALKTTDGDGFTDEKGRPLLLLHGAGRTITELRDRDRQIAVLEHDPALLRDPALLESVTSLVGIAIDNAALQREVTRRIADVESSRYRLLTVADAERDRLEADLQDRVLARLERVAALVTHPGLGDDLGDLVCQTREAVSSFARGVHPRRLDEEGLRVAIADLTGVLSTPVELDVLPGRFSREVEAAAYFVCAEALTNAAKHARASRVRVSMRRSADKLTIEVNDDGIGGAVLASDGGLLGLQDRLDVLGGTLWLVSHPNQGTTVLATIPLSRRASEAWIINEAKADRTVRQSVAQPARAIGRTPHGASDGFLRTDDVDLLPCPGDRGVQQFPRQQWRVRRRHNK
jgi:signal transduction histidine kinase